MPTRQKKSDPRNFIIVLLLGIIVVLSFNLLPKKKSVPVLSKKSEEVAKSSVPSEKGGTLESSPAKIESAPKPIPAIVTSAPVQPKSTVSEISGNGARIAIILDDWGYHLDSCQALKDIAAPLAVSILPKLEFSQKIAECAKANHKDVMLHLPLEPHQYFEHYPPNYYIKTSMIQAQIERKVNEALDGIPYVQGVNNHTGSKATEDRRTMSIVFAQLKARHLFFVDSFVTSQSICKPLAQEIKIPFARRDIFLDNTEDRAYIKSQFDKLAKLARKRGWAIAIGHDRPLTLQILKEEVERLQKEGFRIVSIQELLK